MRAVKLLFLGWVIHSLTFFSLAHSASAPNQSTVDLLITAAINFDFEKLPQSGAVKCHYLPGALNAGEAYGPSAKSAQTGLAMLCIRDGCNSLGKKILTGMESILALSDNEFRELLRGLGHSPESIQNALDNRRSYDTGKLTSIDCRTATPMARAFVVDSCYSTPMICN